MKFAKRTFLIAGVYGLILLIPYYFLEDRIGRDQPPAITHPEFFYGFVGVAIAWQVMFLIIAKDPARYRLAMIPSIIEKLSFAIAGGVLFAQGRVVATVLPFLAIDLLLAMLFAIAFIRTRDGH